VTKNLIQREEHEKTNGSRRGPRCSNVGFDAHFAPCWRPL